MAQRSESSQRRTAPKTEKLARYLARCGVDSRRRCEDMIRAGWVRIDGQVVNQPETRIASEGLEISVRGRRITAPSSFRYIILNKPAGVICTCRPSREKGPTILNLVNIPERVYPAGRLDRDTSGLVLLTNDGELAQRLTHPSYQKEKEYLIDTRRPLADEDLDRLRRGVMLEDGHSRFSSIARVGKRRLKVTLTEGRKRQIRRTLNAIGLSIGRLHRIRLGALRLSQLPSGQWRNLDVNEIRRLKT